MEFQKKISIIVPTLNEEQNIPELVETNYTLDVVFVQDPENYQDIMFINLKVADYDIYAQIGQFT